MYRLRDLKHRVLFPGVLVSIMVSALFSGCASNSVKSPQGEEEIENPGYLVGTITAVEGMYEEWSGMMDTKKPTRFLGYTLYYRDADRFVNTKSGYIWISGNVYTRQFDEDFTRPFGKAFVFAIPLQPGEYVFNNYRLFFTQGASWQAEGDFSIPFEIQAGKVTYVGDWRAFALKDEKTVLGMTSVAGGFWAVSDMRETDLERIYAKHPELTERPVIYSVHTKLLKDYFEISDPLIENE